MFTIGFCIIERGSVFWGENRNMESKRWKIRVMSLQCIFLSVFRLHNEMIHGRKKKPVRQMIAKTAIKQYLMLPLLKTRGSTYGS